MKRDKEDIHDNCVFSSSFQHLALNKKYEVCLMQKFLQDL